MCSQTGKTIYLWILLCAWGHCHVETDHRQTAASMLEADYDSLYYKYNISLYAVALRFPLTRTEGPKP